MDVTAAVVVLAGLLLGALLNVVIIRLPRERDFGGMPRCTRCGRRLSFWQLIPLVGWLAQGGRGRCCGQRLHWIYPLVEVLCAAALLLFYLRYSISPAFGYLTFVAAVLLVTGAIDWLHRTIYTLFILLPALLALALAPLVPEHRFADALIGMLISGIIFVIMFMLARILFPGRAAPFGLGDVYLGIFIGAAVGISNLMPALFYGILLAGIFSAVLILLRRAGRPNIPEYISYGAFLCLGTLGYLVIGGLSGF